MDSNARSPSGRNHHQQLNSASSFTNHLADQSQLLDQSKLTSMNTFTDLADTSLAGITSTTPVASMPGGKPPRQKAASRRPPAA